MKIYVLLLSSALRGVMLFEDGDEARRRAERAEKSMSDFIAVISKELQNSIDAWNASLLQGKTRSRQ